MKWKIGLCLMLVTIVVAGSGCVGKSSSETEQTTEENKTEEAIEENVREEISSMSFKDKLGCIKNADCLLNKDCLELKELYNWCYYKMPTLQNGRVAVCSGIMPVLVYKCD